jgi:type IV fimbrial biogenesis protein FimT
MKKSNDGYSLFELLMTLGIFAIVMTLGLPSMGNMVASHRLRVEIDMLFHAVHLARKESVVRRRVVTICPTRDGENCEPTNDWTVGWMMFVNHDRSNAGTRDQGEPVLKYSQPGNGVRISANRHSFSLRSTELRATNGTIVFCDSAGRIPARALVISYTGRPRAASRDSRGRAYQCAH